MMLCSATPSEMVSGNKVTIEGLTKGKAYEFRIAAVNGVGIGEYAQTKEPCTPPSSFSYLRLSIKRSTQALFVEDISPQQNHAMAATT